MTLVTDLYQDRELFSTPDMFSPPAERRNHVVRFELTQGCDWNACTFCDGYKGVPFREKSLEEYKEHVDKIFLRLGNNWIDAPHNRRILERVFIGGGNALAVDTEKLAEAIKYTSLRFLDFTDRSPRRVAVYGRTDSIIGKGSKNLQELGRSGLGLIYWGVESGSNNVLNYVNKRCSKEDILKAAEEIKKCTYPIPTSVMIMPGLGGKKFYDEHVKETAEVLGKIKPRFITFMGINPSANSLYERRMRNEEARGTNRRLSDFELGEQIIDILREMPRFNTSVGSYDCSVDEVGHNPLTFSSANFAFKQVILGILETRLRDLSPEQWESRREDVEKELKRARRQERLVRTISKAGIGFGIAGMAHFLTTSVIGGLTNSEPLLSYAMAGFPMMMMGGGMIATMEDKIISAGERVECLERALGERE